ncbi:uncharacterized protein LOC144026105 [Festucalex cinctus]
MESEKSEGGAARHKEVKIFQMSRLPRAGGGVMSGGRVSGERRGTLPGGCPPCIFHHALLFGGITGDNACRILSVLTLCIYNIQTGNIQRTSRFQPKWLTSCIFSNFLDLEAQILLPPKLGLATRGRGNK